MMEWGENGMRKFAVIVGIAIAFFSRGTEATGQQMHGPRGTLDEAVAKMRSQRADVAKIFSAVKNDMSISGGGVSANIDVAKADNLDLTDPGTRSYVSSYKAMQALLIQGGFTDLDSLRDKKSKLKWVDLYIFNNSSSDRMELINAEWRAPGVPLQHSEGKPCIPVYDGWYVCQTGL
jgi:hypothetical protein